MDSKVLRHNFHSIVEMIGSKRYSLSLRAIERPILLSRYSILILCNTVDTNTCG